MIRKVSSILLLFALFLICQRLNAQNTWGGLQFGMSPAQVRSTFRMPVHEATGVEMVRDFPYTLVSEQQVAIQKIGFTPKFSFDDKHRLQLITLFSLKDDPAL